MISAAALDVLRAAQATEDRVVLPPTQLPRDLYEEVDEVLTRLRGKWKGGRTKAHLFPHDPRPLLTAVLDSGQMPQKNPLAYFPTPAPVVERMLTAVEQVTFFPGCGFRVLEPSAGTGAIADALRELSEARGFGLEVECVELDPINRAQLEAKGHRLVGDDFLRFTPEWPYRIVVMNPPFSVDGERDAFVTHVERAWGMLEEGGVLAAIVPPSPLYRKDARLAAFRDWVRLHGWIEELPDGAFKESGTGTNTCLLLVRKEDQAWREKERSGWPNYHAWALALHVDSDPFAYERVMERVRAGHLNRTVDALRVVALEYVRHHEPIRTDDDVLFAVARHFFAEVGNSVEEASDRMHGGLFA